MHLDRGVISQRAIDQKIGMCRAEKNIHPRSYVVNHTSKRKMAVKIQTAKKLATLARAKWPQKSRQPKSFLHNEEENGSKKI
jgi:hypothetical protein